MNPPPDRVIGALDARLVIDGKPQLEHRNELEKLLVQEAGTDGVPAGHLLDRRLGQPASPLRFYGGHIACPVKPGEIVRDAATLFLQERLGRGVHRVVA